MTLSLFVSINTYGQSYNANSQSSPPYEKITIALDRNASPLSFINVFGNPDGYLIDLWERWSKITGTPISFVMMTWPQALNAVEKGKIDIASGLFLHKIKMKNILFSPPLIPPGEMTYYLESAESLVPPKLISGGGVNTSPQLYARQEAPNLPLYL